MNPNRAIGVGKLLPQITREQAIKLAESGVWKTWDDEKIVKFQLYQDRMAMDFDRFHQALEKCLGRSVCTHELADIESIRMEFEGIKAKPTFDEIMALIPKDKLIPVVTPSHNNNKTEGKT